MKILETIRTKIHNARAKTQQTLFWDDYSRVISPDLLTEYDRFLEIDNTLVECVVVGLPQQTTDGYPAKLKPNFLERLMNVSLAGVRLSISFGLVPIPTAEAQKMLADGVFMNATNQMATEKTNPFGMSSIIQQLDAQAMAASIAVLHNNEEKMFHSAFIITIWAEDATTMRKAKSHINTVLNSNNIYGTYPIRRMRKTFVAAQAYPVFEPHTFVELFSEPAGLLCPVRNPNSSLANSERGLYLGDDRKTGKEICIDLDALTAKHFLIFGNSGAGKTFAMLLMLMRLYAELRRQVVYVTVKDDEGTKYLGAAEHFAPDSCVCNIGPGGNNINPLQIMHTGDGLTAFESEVIYDRHKMLVYNFFKMWLTDSFSPNMEAFLSKVLTHLYTKRGIFRSYPSSWKNMFPVMADMVAHLTGVAGNDESPDQATAQALLRKMYMFEYGEPLSYMNRQTDVDLTKGFTVIDLVRVPLQIRDAMNALVTGMLMTFFERKRERGVTIAVDEGGAFLRDRQRAEMILQILTQGRSYDIQLIFATQNVGDLEKAKMSEEFMTNTPVKIVIGRDLDQKSKKYIQDFLLLSDEATIDLNTVRKGQGIVKIGDIHAPIEFNPSDEEFQIIKGVSVSESLEIPAENRRSASQTKIIETYINMAKENKIVCDDWIEGENAISELKQVGYRAIQEQGVTGGGFKTWYVSEEILREDGKHILNQGTEHYCSVMQLLGILHRYGKTDFVVNHADGVDLSDGETAYEYEVTGSHSEGQLREKVSRALETHQEVYFVGSGTVYDHLVKSVGPERVLKRGKQLEQFLEKRYNQA